MHLSLRAVAFGTLMAAHGAVAATVVLPPGSSVQAAVDAAAPGDLIRLEPGEYPGDVDYSGKAIEILGAPGWVSILRGTGAGPVVTFASGEGLDSILDGVTVTGGAAQQGGGVYVSASSPWVRRTRIYNNRAQAAGSGIYVGQGSLALMTNNVVVWNRRVGDGDPHNVQIAQASPLVANNTIVRGDSNGLLISGSGTPLVINNVLAHNAGRGICDFSGGGAQIWYNAFFRNRKAALLTDGRNWDRVANAQNAIGAPRLIGNFDGRPGFDPAIPRGAESGDVPFTLGPDALARDAGHPFWLFEDLDGTRNDLGATGGPLSILE